MIPAPRLPRRVDHQPVEGRHPHPPRCPRERLCRRRDHLLACREREHRLLGRMDADRHHHLVGQGERGGKNVDMAVGDRVEGARVECGSRHVSSACRLKPVADGRFLAGSARPGKAASAIAEGILTAV